ncbi:RIBULOSE-phosphate 3-epimerase [Pleurotus pulmonarius]|nr:RIBULOSE-phosphate 3-epimerase [Pleurotus pulmonarius]
MDSYRSLRYPASSMPRAIISPSVLASDFGQLTAECKRMIKGGAEWLHMGALSTGLCPQFSAERSDIRCYGWVTIALFHWAVPRLLTDYTQDTSCPISPWVRHLNEI